MGLERCWGRIVAWCAAHAPRTLEGLRPAAPPESRASAERATGGGWPDDLRRWFALHDGIGGAPYAAILTGGFRPIPVREVVDTWRMYREIFDGFDGTEPAGLDRREPAGTVALAFLPSFIPIARDGAGCALFVDTRPGPEHGCVRGFMREEADAWGPTFRSVTALVEQVADRMEEGRSIDGWHPRVVDGVFGWDPFPPGSARASRSV